MPTEIPGLSYVPLKAVEKHMISHYIKTVSGIVSLTVSKNRQTAVIKDSLHFIITAKRLRRNPRGVS